MFDFFLIYCNMFRRTLYNNDAIYSIKEDKVYFVGEQGYEDYLKWAKENKFLDEADERTKKGTLLWNQGKPHNVGDQQITHDKNGKKISAIRELSDGSASQVLYDFDGNLFGYTTTKFGISISVTYDKGLTSKVLFTKKDRTLREVFYYPYSKQINKKITLKDNKKHYIEYYNSGQLRSKGEVLEEDTPHGIWEFYHYNGNRESQHHFDKGRLVDNSTIYHEDGALSITVNHD